MTLLLENTNDTNTSDTNASEPDPQTDPAPKADPPITPVVMGSLGLLGAGAAIVGAAGWADPNPTVIVALGLAVVAGGLIARSFLGGGRGLIPVGIVMMLAVLVTAIASPFLDDGTGDRTYHPTSFSEVETEYRFGIGNLDVDLRDVEFPPGVHVIEVDHGIGSADVWLPTGVNYEVVGDVEIGDLDLFGETEDGFGNELDAAADVDGTATVIVDFEVGIGYGRVRND
jgi:hypothetical protein